MEDLEEVEHFNVNLSEERLILYKDPVEDPIEELEEKTPKPIKKHKEPIKELADNEIEMKMMFLDKHFSQDIAIILNEKFECDERTPLTYQYLLKNFARLNKMRDELSSLDYACFMLLDKIKLSRITKALKVVIKETIANIKQEKKQQEEYGLKVKHGEKKGFIYCKCCKKEFKDSRYEAHINTKGHLTKSKKC